MRLRLTPIWGVNCSGAGGAPPDRPSAGLAGARDGPDTEHVSDANVDIVRRLYAVFGEGAPLAAAARGAGGFDDLWALIDEDVEVSPAQQSPLARVYRGHDGARTFFGQVFEVWDESGYRREPDAFHVAGDEVVVTVRLHARFKGTGIELDERWADVWTLRRGRVVRLRSFTDPAEALQAAGVQVP